MWSRLFNPKYVAVITAAVEAYQANTGILNHHQFLKTKEQELSPTDYQYNQAFKRAYVTPSLKPSMPANEVRVISIPSEFNPDAHYFRASQALNWQTGNLSSAIIVPDNVSTRQYIATLYRANAGKEFRHASSFFKTVKKPKSSPKAIAGNILLFSAAHEASHINHHDGLTDISTAAVKVGADAALTTVALRQVGLLVSGIMQFRAKALLLPVAIFANQLLGHALDHRPEKFFRPAGNSFTSKTLSSVVSNFMERRADSSAIESILEQQTPEEAVEVFKAAKFMFETEAMPESGFFTSHPHPRERIRMLDEAIERAEQTMAGAHSLS